VRKIFVTVFFVFLSTLLVYGYADAITGVCSNCHTMHDSQDGQAVTTGGPYEQLLVSDCVGCHTAATGKTSTFGAPAVLHTTAPAGQGGGYTLAGGDFYWVATGYGATDSKGHNVEGIASFDATIGNEPPGWDQAATTGLTFDGKTLEVTGGLGWTGKQLTCAGTFGCHGTRDEEGMGGIKGAHHGNTGETSTQASAPSTVGDSYRFLAAIKGLENADWNWNETASTHNEYYGENNTADRSAGANYGSKDTISFLCAECHGVFHATIDADSTSGSPWIRHPTDIVLPSSGEYALYNTSDGLTVGSYSLEAPVARPTVPATSSFTVTPGDSSTDTGAIVMCLSCHRAHGSNQSDLLRWDYNNMIAGGSNTGGCFVCHTEKNASGANP
jgi:predicted CXXCH cytochrome family protein